VDRERARELGRAVHGSSDDPEVLDFSANTNPETPDGVETVYREAFASARRYPPEPSERFREAAAEYVACDPDQVVPAPGGLAVMRLAISLAVDPGETALVPAPSFSEYAREVRLQGGDPVFVDERDVLDVDPSGHALAVVCNPNNPTGRVYGKKALLSFADRCRAAGTVLLVDEAFLGFTDRTSMAGVEGIVVARSLTKLFGLPGIRTGFAVATGDRLAELRAARRPWNLGTPALATGAFCLHQDAFVTATRERVRRERERMADRLGDRFAISASAAPFLLLAVESAEEALSRARAAGIAIRDARTFRELDSHVRVAVRLPAENDRLLEALDV